MERSPALRRPKATFALYLSAIALLSAREGLAHASPKAPIVPPGAHYRPLCPTADAYGRRCFGQILVDADDQPIMDPMSPPGGWAPADLEEAYGLPKTGGNGRIIATYIGNHYTNAEADMAAYRTKFGMSPCTAANGCFMQVTDKGTKDFSGLSDDGCNGFIGEFSLDMDMLMAGCPDCKILLIEGNDHAGAMKTAAHLGAVSISMSWGYGISSASDCTDYNPPPGLSLFAADGDNGFTGKPGAPAECTNVIAVGWTKLVADSSARGYSDTLPSGWGSAGGCSGIIPKGAWQTDPSCGKRMISDISANGDNVAAYCTSPAGSAHWHVTGGSSASSPFISGVLARLGVSSIPGFDAAWLYTNSHKFLDVTSGGPVANCPKGSPPYYCNAVAGYDGPTGVGVPYGPLLEDADAGAHDDAGASDASAEGDATVASDAGAKADAGHAPDAGVTPLREAGAPNDAPGGGEAEAGCSCSAVGSHAPGSRALFGFGLLGIAALRRRRK